MDEEEKNFLLLVRVITCARGRVRAPGFAHARDFPHDSARVFHPYSKLARPDSMQPRREVKGTALFVARVLSLQQLYPTAHDELRNWGRWSRQGVGKDLPTLDPQPLSKLYHPKDYEDDEIALGENVVEEDESPIPIDELNAQRLDILLHRPDCAKQWQYVVRLVYFSNWVRIERYTRMAAMTDEAFLMTYEVTLQWVGERIGCRASHCARVLIRAVRGSSKLEDATSIES